MSKIREMLADKKTMRLNEFYAAACAMVPAEATRYGRFARLSMVRNFVRAYQHKLLIMGDMIEYREPVKSELKGHRMLRLLQQQGKITRDESGFKKETWASYRRALKRLNWVIIENTDELVWCGPDNATWAAVTIENDGSRRKKRKEDK